MGRGIRGIRGVSFLFLGSWSPIRSTRDITPWLVLRNRTMASIPRSKWYKIQWYSDDDTPEEKKFIWKLDLLVVPYAVLSYWVKYIDQANLSLPSNLQNLP